MKTIPAPKRIARLKRDKAGRPVPWFVQWFEGGKPTDYGVGEPDFRVVDARKVPIAVRESRCWICGDHLSAKKTFPIGPMCCITRNIAEPPAHLECCAYSAQVCPFLTRPAFERPSKPLPEGVQPPAGEMIPRNPGVVCLWTTRSFSLMQVDNGVLFHLGLPEAIEWWAEGKPASLGQIAESIRTGLPILFEAAQQGGQREVQALIRCIEEAIGYVPGLTRQMIMETDAWANAS